MKFEEEHLVQQEQEDSFDEFRDLLPLYEVPELSLEMQELGGATLRLRGRRLPKMRTLPLSRFALTKYKNVDDTALPFLFVFFRWCSQ